MFLIFSSLFRPPPPDSCATLTTPGDRLRRPGQDRRRLLEAPAGLLLRGRHVARCCLGSLPGGSSRPAPPVVPKKGRPCADAPKEGKPHAAGPGPLRSLCPRVLSPTMAPATRGSGERAAAKKQGERRRDWLRARPPLRKHPCPLTPGRAQVPRASILRHFAPTPQARCSRQQWLLRPGTRIPCHLSA